MFTPIQTTLGALLLHYASSGLLLHNGRVFGISSLLSGCAARPSRDDLSVIIGMISGIVPVALFTPSLLPSYPAPNPGLTAKLGIVAIGALVGWGTKNGRGCTSGHMLCGFSRLSIRSEIATGLFFTAALITANITALKSIPSCGDQPCYTPSNPSGGEFILMSAAVALSAALEYYLIPLLSRTRGREDKPPSSSVTEGSEAVSTAWYGFVAGLQFGLGLIFTGMADPLKVLRFFSWMEPAGFDPSLALVLLFGVGPGILTWLRLQKDAGDRKTKPRPTFASKFQLPTATVKDIDWRFIVGTIIFGVGWGMAGVCPGPGLLRAALQPSWGLLWLAGFLSGSLSGI